MRLQQRQARETGICPIRRQLYTQCFGKNFNQVVWQIYLLLQIYFFYKYAMHHKFISDELIRQVTVNCAERGLLLLRIRDEIRMTLLAYQTLYQSSIAFGMRKALQVCTCFFIYF